MSHSGRQEPLAQPQATFEEMQLLIRHRCAQGTDGLKHGKYHGNEGVLHFTILAKNSAQVFHLGRPWDVAHVHCSPSATAASSNKQTRRVRPRQAMTGPEQCWIIKCMHVG